LEVKLPGSNGEPGKPLLRQFAELRPADFERHPVWVGCHIVDYDEPWYDETDEETFRPWLEPTPVDPTISLLLVRARVVLKDGTEYVGFVTPAQNGYMGESQPHAFVKGRLFMFWGGRFGVPEELKRDFYAAVGKKKEGVFPLQVVASADLVRDGYKAEVLGFYRKTDAGFDVE
jgi:hypothetical protein